MEEIFNRLELLIGKEKVEYLHKKTVAIFGLGGVGSYVVEGLARSGIGNFILIDGDKVDITNLNRQIIATTKTIGMNKVDVEEERIKEINPNVKVTKFDEFITDLESNIELVEDLKKADYIVDAIDTVSSKIKIIEFSKKNNIPVISALGTGNKLDPTKLKLVNLYDTKICPLAKVMRKELKKRNITSLDVVYSEEEPIKILEDYKGNENIEENEGAKKIKKIGSIAFVPSSCRTFN